MNENYNKNSRPQLAAIDSTLEYIQEAIHALDIQHFSVPLIIADFGSAHGSNSMHAVKSILQCLKETNRIEDEKEVLVIHNDLPNNTWTTLFDLLNADNSYYGLANGRSFYEPCLPPNSVSIVYSSTALHWLSRKPCNISNHCSSLFAQGEELQAFREQACFDWIHFLQHRSRELIDGGVLILLIPCVDDQGSNGFDIIRELLYECAKMILTSQELLDYTLPIYARSYSECLNNELFENCALQLVRSDFNSVRMPFSDKLHNGQITPYVRSWSEAILEQTLTINNRSKSDIEQVLNQFWPLYDQLVRENVDRFVDSRMNYTYLILKKVKNNIK